MNRRHFLETIAMAPMVLSSSAAGAATPTGTREQREMLRRKIPAAADGESVPVIGMGTWNTFDVGGGVPEREPLKRVLEVFYESGARLIDSSPMYGNAERVTGELVQQLGKQSSTFFATKVWTSGRDKGLAQIERSMRLMKTPRLDLLQIHNLLDWRTHAASLRQLKSDGKIRYAGVTHYTVGAHDEIESVLRAAPFDFAQFNYSIGTRAAERRLLPYCQDYGIGVLINRPFEEGALFTRVRDRKLPGYAKELGCTSWAQLFLKYIVSHPAVTCVIPATSRAEHMQDNLQAGFGPVPDAAMRERMAREFEAA
jgi:diketogulonate reductase-like aldo/keto reductase